MVEFALVFPILMVLLLGIISVGLLWNSRLQMAHASREGARYGSAVPLDQTFANGDTWAVAVRRVVVERSAGELEDADVCVALVSGESPAVWDGDAQYTTKADGTRCYDDSADGDTSIRVQVTADSEETLDVGFWTQDIDLHVQATARHELEPS